MHDEHSPSRSEVWLGRQLRDAARREQPPFSEALHQRIMEAVRPAVTGAAASESVVATADCAEPAEVARSGSSRRGYWRGAAWLTAAAAILAMVIAAHRFAGSENHNSAQPPHLPQSAVVGQTMPTTKHAVEPPPAKLAENTPQDVEPDDVETVAMNYTLDDLTRDAQATAHLLVDQLPFETPADEWGL